MANGSSGSSHRHLFLRGRYVIYTPAQDEKTPYLCAYIHKYGAFIYNPHLPTGEKSAIVQGYKRQTSLFT